MQDVYNDFFRDKAFSTSSEFDFVLSLSLASGLVSVLMVWQNASIEVSLTEKLRQSKRWSFSHIFSSDVDGLLISVVLVLHEG